MSPALGKFVACKTHRDNSGGPRCWSCECAIDWNVWRQWCYCGAPATGYRVLTSLESAEFFCDKHWTPLAVSAAPGGPAQEQETR